MPSLGSLWYTMGIKDLTDADLKKINAKLKSVGSEIQLTPKILKDLTQSAVPKGIKIELDPTIKNEALARAVEGKTMRVAVTPLLTGFREAIVRATRENPPQAEIGVSAERLRRLIENVLSKQGFMLNISTVNDNYSKTIQQKLNGTRYTVKIHADTAEVTRSVQASLMQVQSRYFGLKVSRDILYRSIDEALGQKRFTINIAVQQDQARRAVQDALLRAQIIGKDQALAYQRLQTGEMKAAQAELLRLKAAHMGAADAAKAHATASVSLGGATRRNITIANKLGSAMASLYSVHAAKQFLSQVIKIGGELEHQKIAMDTIFGDKGKTNVLFEQVKGLARTSPFGVMELSKSVKALSAYGVQYNEIYDTAKRLADISAATSVDINRLILAFGKTKSRGFLDGLEAKQFAYANIPIYEMVRKKLEKLEGQAVTTQEVMERMSKREISFDIVKDVLWDITDPGGKFYDMQEALAGSVKTSWKLVRDNIELMFGEIAESAVGNTLKSTAEVLQGLTRAWRTVGMVVGTAAIGLGVYKVATLGVNSAVQKGTIATYKQIIAQKQKEAEELKAWGRITQLDRAEKMRILTANKLTNADLRQALTDGMLTDKHIAQLFWQKKVTAEQVKYLANIGLLNPEMAKATLSTSRFTLSLQMMKQGLVSAGKAIGAFLFNPWTIGIAALSGLMALWQRNTEQMEKSKEIGENLFTRATESAKNLKAVLAEVGDEVEKSTDIKIAEAISKLETAIKDYSPTPEKTLRETRLDESGKIRSSQEYAKALQAEVKALEEAATLEEKIDIGKISENAMNNAKGILDDNLAKDLEQYADSFKKANSKISKYISDNPRKVKQYVDGLAEIDSGFAEATKGMDTYAAKFREMVVNADKYSFAIEDEDIQNLLSIFTSKISTDKRSLIGRLFSSDPQAMKKGRREFETELKEYMRYVKSTLEEEGISVGEGINMSKPIQIMMSRLANTILENAKSLPQDQQDAIRELWNSFFGLDFDDTLIFGGISDRVKDSLNKLPKVLSEKLRNGISYDELKGADKELVDEVIESSAQEVEKKFPYLTNKIHDKLKSEKFIAEIVFSLGKNAALSDWQRQLNDAIGDEALKALDISIGGKANIDSFIDEARKGYKAANEAIKELKPILIKAGIDFVDGQEITAVPPSLKGNDVALQAIDEYNKKIRATKATKDALKEQGIDLDVDPDKNQRTPKDPLAESLKQRFKDIKDAWSEFQKWSKTEGREAAATRIGESGLFSTLSVEQIPQTVEQYRALVVELENELRQAGVKGTAREGLLNDLLKQLLDIDKTVVDEQLKLALDNVSKEAERQLADWNLYKKLEKATGNKQFAMNFAFGFGVSGQTDYESIVKDKFNAIAKAYKSTLTFDTATPDLLANAPDEVKKEWEKAYNEIQKYRDKEREEVADMVVQYRNTQEEIIALTAEAEEKKRKIRESNLTPVEKQQITAQIDADLNYEVFRKSGEYLKFFNAILSMTGKEAEDVGRKIKEALDEKLKAGRISAKDYCDEMEKIDEQLEKIRQKQKGFGGLGSFAKGGLQQMFKDRFDQAQSDYNAATQNFDTAKQQFDLFSKEGNEAGIQQAQSAMDAASAMKEGASAAMQGAQSGMATIAIIDKIVHGINDTVQGIKGSFDLIADMADSFGVDTSADTGWGAGGAFLDAFSQASQHATDAWDSLKSGNVGGVIQGVVGSVTSWFTTFNRWHDAKLQKQIERSKEAAQIMQNQYDILEKRMANFLGNAANMKVEGYSGEGGAYGKQRQLMQSQLTELETQRQAEIDKKKTDNSVVEDYDKQIEEMKISIRNFAQEAAKDVYSIDLSGWAEQLGDSLVDAFAAGEDAAEAFDKTVGDIMRDVTSKMISQDILASMFGDLRTFLFGENGTSGVFGADFKLDASEVAAMKTYLDKIKNEGIPAAEELFNAINSATGGMLDDTDKAKSGLTAGIQAMTEDTGDLVASYLNGIRGDVSMQTHELWPRLLDVALPQISVIAQSQLDTQRQIAENTLRNAVAAEAIQVSTAKLVELNDQMGRSWRRIAERNWGYS